MPPEEATAADWFGDDSISSEDLPGPWDSSAGIDVSPQF